MLISQITARVKRFTELGLQAASPRVATVIAPRQRLLALLVIIASIAGFASLAGDTSQAPGTIKIIVPSSAGGGADILARMLADQISRQRGVAVAVEDRPG